MSTLVAASSRERAAHAAAQVLALSRRSVLRIARQPAEAVPALVFPLIFLALLSAAASRAADIPGFPAPSYTDFALAGVLIQGAVLSGVNAGASLAIDIEEGFLRRLNLTPLLRPILLLGHLSGSMIIGAAQGVVFLVVATVAGVSIQAGLAGGLLLVALNGVVALAFSGIGAILAVRTRSSEAVQSAFPLFFIFLSFSSFFMPRDLITQDWFRGIANVNPASYIVEAGRSLVITGWDPGALATGFAAAGAVAAVAIAIAAAGLRTILART